MTEITGQLSTALADRYRIERHIGEGGMATVYLAHDIKHDRKVALKVLRPELAAMIGAERFLQEIKVTANLQHPHILPLHDSGTVADSTGTLLFYVMPYVEGETLRDKIDREKQLAVDEAVEITKAVSSALDYAHRHEVVHRDIKPENILLHDGQALVADFGIALAVSEASGKRLTETGLSIGTPHYMSPEQAMGDRELDARSDVYSLGAMLYEMLAGDPPYTGSTAQAIVAKVITEKAPLVTAARPAVPPNVASAIEKALEKLPADRFTSAARLADALSDAGFTVATRTLGASPTVASTRSPRVVQYAGWGVATVVSIVLLLGQMRSDPPAPVTRYSVRLPEPLLMTQNSTRLAVAKDGANLAYVTPGDGTTRQIAVRGRSQLNATLLPGTDAVQSPFLSPDGRTVAYFVGSGGILRLASLGGAPALTLSDSGFGGAGGSWGRDGYIYGQSSTGISRLPVGGGAMENVSTLDSTGSECGHFWPDALPNGKGVLFSIAGFPCTDLSQFRIGVVDIASGQHQVLVGGVHAQYALSGHILVVTSDGTMLAAPFDQDRLEMGSAGAVLEGVNVRNAGVVDIGITDDGTLVYVSGVALGGALSNEAVWVDRQGRATPVDTSWRFEALGNAGWTLSPDGQRLAIKLNTGAGQDIYVKRLDDGPSPRLTFDPAVDIRPHWTPDGQSVTFISQRNGQYDLFIRRYDGTGVAEQLLDLDLPVLEAVWSSDGEWLVLRTGGVAGQAGGRDVWGFRPALDSVPTPLVTSEFDERGIALSPDKRWLAYESDETGRNEIYVRPFPNTEGGKWQVTPRGGRAPLWAHNGRELFYIDADDNMTMAKIEPGAEFAWATETLFALGAQYVVSTNYTFYDIAPNDERFIMVRVPIDETTQSELIVVENFFEELNAKVGN